MDARRRRPASHIPTLSVRGCSALAPTTGSALLGSQRPGGLSSDEPVMTRAVHPPGLTQRPLNFTPIPDRVVESKPCSRSPTPPNSQASYVWASGSAGNQRLIASSNSAALTGLGM
jgi:hypothetical protein